MNSKPIEIIVAATPRGEIGYQNTIPWRLKGDLKRFKALTQGHILIMGRNTYESLPTPLEGRILIVVSKQLSEVGLEHPEHWTAPSMEAALAMANAMVKGDKIFIAGGAGIYETALTWPDVTLQLTLVHKGDNQPYDTVIKNFNLIDFFFLEGEPEEVYDTPEDGERVLSHTYITMKAPTVIDKTHRYFIERMARSEQQPYQFCYR